MNRFNGVCHFLQAPPFTTLDTTVYMEWLGRIEGPGQGHKEF